MSPQESRDAVVPFWVLQHHAFDRTEIAVYAVLDMYAHPKTHQASPSVATIVNTIGMARKTRVRDALRTLAKYGAIEHHRRGYKDTGGWNTNTYVVHKEAPRENHVERDGEDAPTEQAERRPLRLVDDTPRSKRQRYVVELSPVD